MQTAVKSASFVQNAISGSFTLYIGVAMKRKVLALFALLAFAALGFDDDWKASRLMPGDVLSVSVFRVNEFSKSVRIEEDGAFSYPLCGTIQAAGKTSREIARELEKRLEGQVTNPNVDVIVSTWAPRTVYLLGELKSSMQMELPTYGRLTALQAISAAGGFTESADLNNVVVLRRNPENDSELLRLKIDVSALASRSSGGDSFRLMPEDTLIVPKAPPVYISGEIGRAGSVYIDTQNPPLCSEFIIRNGGLTDAALASSIFIVRIDEDGKRNLLTASLEMTAPGEYANDLRIKPGDSILVPAARKIYVLGEVKKPGPLVVAPNTIVTASQAIALAGGFSKVAKQSDVTLIRDRVMTSLNLKKLYDKVENMDRDLELKYGDIIFVRESMF